jgi:hypothetical protein
MTSHRIGMTTSDAQAVLDAETMTTTHTHDDRESMSKPGSRRAAAPGPAGLTIRR